MLDRVLVYTQGGLPLILHDDEQTFLFIQKFDKALTLHLEFSQLLIQALKFRTKPLVRELEGKQTLRFRLNRSDCSMSFGYFITESIQLRFQSTRRAERELSNLQQIKKKDQKRNQERNSHLE